MSSLALALQQFYANRGQPTFASLRRYLPSVLAVALLLAAALYTRQLVDDRQAALWLLGGALGFALFYTVFSFAGAWRRAIVERRGGGLYAQLLMLALATPLFYPAVAGGELFGQTVGGIVRPVGVALLAGAFLFGVGMQLAGSCSSGTLATLGGGRAAARIDALLALAGIVAGATWASADYEWWQQQSTWFDFSLIREYGAAPAIVANLAIVAALTLLFVTLERRRHGRVRVPAPALFVGGAAALALLNLVTLALTGRPWVIADAFPLWGARLSELAGFEFDFFFWEYWAGDARQDALEQSLWAHGTTVMNGGLVLGALAAAALGRRPAAVEAGGAPATRAGWFRLRPWLAALLGGLLLGYGAIVGLGCNIGAFVGGVVSGSLHGWFWFLAAFAGSAVGVLLRPGFGLPNRAATDV